MILVLVARVDCHCRGLDRELLESHLVTFAGTTCVRRESYYHSCSLDVGTALIRLYEGLDGASWVSNTNWNTSSGTSKQNKANDPCTVGKRWHGVGFMDPCDPYMDDIIGEGPATDYLTKIRGAGQGCFAGRVTSLCVAPSLFSQALSPSRPLLADQASPNSKSFPYLLLSCRNLRRNNLKGNLTLIPELGDLDNLTYMYLPPSPHPSRLWLLILPSPLS